VNNFYFFYLSRIFAMAAVGGMLIVVQFVGLSWHEKRSLGRYERLSAEIADPGTARTEWILWPPQIVMTGAYKGYVFKYLKTRRTFSHLYLQCQPPHTLEVSQRHPNGFRPAAVQKHPLLPGWQALNFFATRVPLLKRSMDRRPLGLGSAPGMDLYRQDGGTFAADIVRDDLENLINYCQADSQS